MIKTPSSFNISDLSVTYPDLLTPYRTNHYQIIWIKKGKGHCRIDLKRFSLTDNTVYCLPPGQMSVFEDVSSIEGEMITFSHSFITYLREDVNILGIAGMFNMDMVNPIAVTGDKIPQIFQNMRAEYNSHHRLHMEVLRSLVHILIIELSRCHIKHEIMGVKINRDVRLVNHFLELVQQHFIEKKRVADYASELLIAPNYLNVKVKKISGYPASYHIQQRILLEAKRQARWEGMSLKQIAYKLGFEDISHFSKFFKKAAGISFSEFKKGVCVM